MKSSIITAEQHVIASDHRPVKGRGALSNLQGRFEHQLREAFDDGWADGRNDGRDRPEDEMPAPQTQITEEIARSILTRNQSPDIPFNVSLNPYRGCEHGCVYCFARPTHSYLELSPGLDFETRLFAKINAAELLRRELASPSWRPEGIALGVNTDAYQPCERKLGITRQVLEVMEECGQPVGLITKSALIERDIDILAAMAKKRQVTVTITITSLDHALSRKLEPRAASPTRRLKTVARLAAAGIPVGVNVAPIIPFITDQDFEQVLYAAAEAGASAAGYIVLRLPWEVNPLFQQWLQTHFPDRTERVMGRLRDMRGGKDYDASYGTRMRGEGIWAELIRQRYEIAMRTCGLASRQQDYAELDSSGFTRPRYIPAAPAKTDGSPHQQDMF
ncbi:PA0069 family radical SAM protein [Pseudohongiella sp.]|uniref:Elp3/MiaA/NifB-like radical SAM core domain-containing protein n=1 Tax=marine sediment metagenome TaxID=412755 RepID=A0A0F9Z4E9_9ZZZZ|nr:PA0069 family radical SAM protein [Pseudohongiella sp.]HDZ07819.1 PA0069 family radical SAM protein [Pseudohongiella sp.]HEA62864.1 PA0069 family radical SAM protein [Pseudohongiella sp.]